MLNICVKKLEIEVVSRNLPRVNIVIANLVGTLGPLKVELVLLAE